MLSLTHRPLENPAPAEVVCWSARKSVVAATVMTFGSARPDRVGDSAVAGGLRDRHAGGHCRVIEQRDGVLHARVRVGVQAERLVEDIDVVGGDGVVDRLQDRGVVCRT